MPTDLATAHGEAYPMKPPARDLDPTHART